MKTHLAGALAPLALLVVLAAAEAHAGGEALPIFVCESHHHALRYWLEAAAAKRLPTSGVTVVHFDAHPDLAVPAEPVPRVLARRPDALVAALDIASFQLAAAWIGLVDRVVWLRPDWAEQLPDGRRDLRLGAARDGRLRVDDRADYWVLERAWAPAAALSDPVPLRVDVMPLRRAAGAVLAEGPAILDVDLDGFATRNPAAERLRAAGFRDEDLARLRRAFARERLDLPEDPPARVAALDEILASLQAAAGPAPLPALAGAFRLWRRGVAASDLWFTWRLLADDESGLGTDVLLESGRDLVGLPEHAARDAEIADTARRLAGLLSARRVRPALVTVARSSRDGFTPAPEVGAIEVTLLAALRRAGFSPEVHYEPGLRPAVGGLVGDASALRPTPRGGAQ